MPQYQILKFYLLYLYFFNNMFLCFSLSNSVLLLQNIVLYFQVWQTVFHSLIISLDQDMLILTLPGVCFVDSSFLPEAVHSHLELYLFQVQGELLLIDTKKWNTLLLQFFQHNKYFTCNNLNFNIFKIMEKLFFSTTIAILTLFHLLTITILICM